MKGLPEFIEELKKHGFNPIMISEHQRGALHLYFERLAEALNDSGLDMKKTLKPEVSIPWDKHNVKEHLWKPIMEAMTNKGSTEEMDKPQVSDVYEVLNRHLAEKFGIHVEFPHREEL